MSNPSFSFMKASSFNTCKHEASSPFIEISIWLCYYLKQDSLCWAGSSSNGPLVSAPQVLGLSVCNNTRSFLSLKNFKKKISFQLCSVLTLITALWRAEAGAVLDLRPGLHGKLQDSQGYIEWPCLKKKKNPLHVYVYFYTNLVSLAVLELVKNNNNKT